MITLKSKLDSSLIFHLDCLSSLAYIAFSSDFEYTISYQEGITGEIQKYKFNFTSKKDYTPNQEVQSVIQYIEKISMNIDSSKRVIIYAPEVDNPTNKPLEMDIRCFEEVYTFLSKVMYGVYLFNSKYIQPVVGSELFLCIGPRRKTLSCSSISRPYGKTFIFYDNGIDWKDNPPFVWNKKRKNAKKAAVKTFRYGISITEPDIKPEDLYQLVKSLHLDSDIFKYNHLRYLIMRGIDGNFKKIPDYLLLLVEHTKSLPNQIEYIIECIGNINLDREMDVFKFEQWKLLLEHGFAWKDMIKLFNFLVNINIEWKFIIYFFLLSMSKNGEEFLYEETEAIQNTRLIVLEYIVDDIVSNISVLNSFLKMSYFEKFLESLFSSNNKSDILKVTKMLQNLPKLQNFQGFRRYTLLCISIHASDILEEVLELMDIDKIIHVIEEKCDIEISEAQKRLSIAIIKCLSKTIFAPLSYGTRKFETLFLQEMKEYPEEMKSILTSIPPKNISFEVNPF